LHRAIQFYVDKFADQKYVYYSLRRYLQPTMLAFTAVSQKLDEKE
jgi:hypothetical protein